MKKYIIIGTFFDMGGGQLYTKNKVDYLKKKGWHVEVYTGRYGKLLIPEFEEFSNNYIKELDYSPFYFSIKKREKIIKQILCNTKETDEIIIESNKKNMALWGELIAECCCGKHVFFNLDEDFPVYSEWYYKFIDFKHNRKELAGIIDSSLSRMFKNYKEVKSNENYHLKFICYASVTNDGDDITSNMIKADYKIGSISRLEKDYINPMLKAIVEVSKRHKEHTFSLVMVGDTNDIRIKNSLLDITKNIENLTVYYTGYLSPIPKSIIDYVDFFIGTSGSAVSTANEGKITITVDTLTAQPIGIKGYDAVNLIYSSGEKGNLENYLDYIFFEANLDEIQNSVKNSLESCDYMTEFDRHMKFIEESSNNKVYFSFDSLPLREEIINLIVQIVGVQRIRKIKRVLSSH